MKNFIKMVLFAIGELFIANTCLMMVGSLCTSVPKNIFSDVCELFAFILFLLAFYAIYYINDYNLFKFCEFNKVKPSVIIKAIIIGLSIPFFNNILQLIINSIVVLNKSGAEAVIKIYESEMTNWFGILSLVVLAPIYEEVFFRGIMLREFLKYLNPAVAIIMQTLVFALLHGNLPQVISMLVLGSVLGVVAYYTKSIITSIFIHISNNALVCLYYNLKMTSLLYYFCIIPIVILILLLINIKNNKALA